MGTAPEVKALATDPDVAPLVAVNYLRWHQRKEWQAEIDAIDRKLTDPTERKSLKDPGRLKRKNDERKALLAQQTPPATLPPPVLVKVAKLREAAKAQFMQGMASAEEERHFRPGTLEAEQQRRWQSDNKEAIILYKRAQMVLHPDSQDRSLCSIEHLRPRHPSVSLGVDSPINRVWTLSPEAKANFDEIDWPHKGESVDAFIARLRALGYTVTKRRGGLRNFGDGPVKPENCRGCGRLFSGRSTKANKARHERHCADLKKKEGVVA